MWEIKQGPGTASFLEQGNQAPPRRHSRSSSVGSSPRVSCCHNNKASFSGFPSPLPLDGFEPQADVVLRPSALHLVERIFKRLLKVRTKASSSSSPVASSGSLCFLASSTSSRAVRDDGRSFSLDSRAEGYDSDEQSGFRVCVHTPTSTSSSSSSSTSRGSSTFESHKPGSQMMANMLLSLLEDETSQFSVREDDDADAGCASGDESEDEDRFSGPRESAWHQPEDEALTDQEWRMMRYGHLQAKPAGTKRMHRSSFKYFTGGDSASVKLQPAMAMASHRKDSFSSRAKRETWKHLL